MLRLEVNSDPSRFDPVYFGHFKCNLLAVRDCPNTLTWLKRIYAIPGVKDTVNMEHIKAHPNLIFLKLICIIF